MKQLSDRLKERIEELQEDVNISNADLNAKHRRLDRHGVRDAVVDIEIAEAKIAAFREVFSWLMK